MKFELNDVYTDMTYHFEILGMLSFSLQFTYYNPVASKYEPIIENAGFLIDYKVGSHTEIPLVLMISLNEHTTILNFNTSYQMLSVIETTRKEWTKNIKEAEVLHITIPIHRSPPNHPTMYGRAAFRAAAPAVLRSRPPVASSTRVIHASELPG